MWHEWSTLKKLIWLHILQGASAIITTVTGTSPLVLDNAVNKAIKSLVQYGKCEVINGEIYCNNGRLIAVDDELPEGYRRQIGFKFDAATYYRITDFHLRGTDTVRFSFSVSKACNVMGCYTSPSANDNYSLYVSTSSGGRYLRYDGDSYNSYIPSSRINDRIDVVITPTGTIGMPTDSVISPVEFESIADLCIGTTAPGATSSKLDGNLWGDFIVDDRLKLIPTERISDGELGYYDPASGAFYEPVGSTPVSLGVDTSHLTVLSVVGTPEVLAVSGTNIFNKDDESSWGGYYVAANGKIADATANLTAAIRCLPNTTYYGIHKSGRGGGRMFTVSTEEWAVGDNANEMQGSASIAADTVFSYTTQADAKWLFVCFGRSTSGMPSFEEQAADFMLSLSPISAATEYVGYSGLPQTATVQNLFEVGGVADEQDIISGVITRKVGVSVVGGVITLSPLATPVTEHTTPQPLSTVEGDNTVTWTAEVSGTVKEVEYAQAAAPSGDNLFIPKNSTGLITSDGKTFRVKEE